MAEAYKACNHRGKGMLGYLLSTEDEQVRGAMRLQETLRNMNYECLLTQVERVQRKFHITNLAAPEGELGGERSQKMSREVREAQLQELRDKLRSKRLHGVFMSETLKEGVDRKATHGWLKDGRMNAESEA